jgi:hypothetical protein
MATDYIPKGIAEFTEYIKNAYTKASANLTTYGLDPNALNKVKPAYDRFITAEATASNPDTATPGARRERDEAWKELESLWRTFINANIRYNELVPPADREAFGLKAADTSRTPAKTPEATGFVSVQRKGAYFFEIRVFDEATGKPKHPLYATGSYVYIAVTDIDMPPGEFHKHDFSSNARHTVRFTRDQIGKQAHVYARYSNSHGKEGPEGPTETFIIS